MIFSVFLKRIPDFFLPIPDCGVGIQITEKKKPSFYEKQAAESARPLVSTALERVAVFGSGENCKRGISLSAITGCRPMRSITLSGPLVHTRDKDAARSKVVAGVVWRPPAHHATGRTYYLRIHVQNKSPVNNRTTTDFPVVFNYNRLKLGDERETILAKNKMNETHV